MPSLAELKDDALPPETKSPRPESPPAMPSHAGLKSLHTGSSVSVISSLADFNYDSPPLETGSPRSDHPVASLPPDLRNDPLPLHTGSPRPASLPSISPHPVDSPPPKLPSPPVMSPSAQFLHEAITQALRDFLPMLNRDLDPRTEFYTIYQRESEDYDKEFIKKHDDYLNTILIFAGLFSAVASAFIIDAQTNLQEDYAKTTAALLLLMLQKMESPTTIINMNLPLWSGPSTTMVQVQSVLYSSLAASLLAAFVAMLGKQWLNGYESVGNRGPLIERCQDRQSKTDGMEKWQFGLVMQSISLVLQAAVLLLGYALSQYLWTINRTVAVVVISITVAGLIFYSSIVVASIVSFNCPFQTPLSLAIRSLVTYARDHNTLEFVSSQVSMAFRKFYNWLRCMGRPTLYTISHPGGAAAEDGKKPKPLFPSTRENPRFDHTPDVHCAVWLLNVSPSPNVTAAADKFLPGIGTYAQTSPSLGSLYDAIFSEFHGNDLAPKARREAYDSAKRFIQAYCQRRCLPSQQGAPKKISLPARTTPECFPEDPDLKCVLEMVQGILKDEVGLISQMSSGVSVSHLSWTLHILLYRIWELQRHGLPIPELVYEFLRDSFSRAEAAIPPENMESFLSDYFLAFGLSSGLQIDPHDLLVNDKSERLDEIVIRLYHQLIFTLENFIPSQSSSKNLVGALSMLNLESFANWMAKSSQQASSHSEMHPAAPDHPGKGLFIAIMKSRMSESDKLQAARWSLGPVFRNRPLYPYFLYRIWESRRDGPTFPDTIQKFLHELSSEAGAANPPEDLESFLSDYFLAVGLTVGLQIDPPELLLNDRGERLDEIVTRLYHQLIVMLENFNPGQDSKNFLGALDMLNVGRVADRIAKLPKQASSQYSPALDHPGKGLFIAIMKSRMSESDMWQAAQWSLRTVFRNRPLYPYFLYRIWQFRSIGLTFPEHIQKFLHDLSSLAGAADPPEDPESFLSDYFMAVGLTVGLQIDPRELLVNDKGERLDGIVTRLYQQLAFMFEQFIPGQDSKNLLGALEMLNVGRVADRMANSSQQTWSYAGISSPAFISPQERLFIAIMNSGVPEPNRTQAARWYLQLLFRNRPFHPYFKGSQSLVMFLYHHFALGGQGDSHTEHIADAFEAFSSPSLQQLSSLPITPNLYLTRMPKALKTERLLRSALFYINWLACHYLEAIGEALEPQVRVEFCETFVPVDLDHNRDVRYLLPYFEVLLRMVNSDIWRPHLLLEHWRILELLSTTYGQNPLLKESICKETLLPSLAQLPEGDAITRLWLKVIWRDGFDDLPLTVASQIRNATLDLFYREGEETIKEFERIVNPGVQSVQPGWMIERRIETTRRESIFRGLRDEVERMLHQKRGDVVSSALMGGFAPDESTVDMPDENFMMPLPDRTAVGIYDSNYMPPDGSQWPSLATRF